MIFGAGWLTQALMPEYASVMRLEPLCRVSMRYEEASWHRPYGRNSDPGREALGFGRGSGTVTGDVLQGRLVWANFPRRREDGVWTPNLRGYIRTDGGSDILLSVHGQSIDQDSPQPVLAILARLEFTTEEPALAWLNACFVVGEGEIDHDTEHWWLDAFVCINEPARCPPALGAEPPARFRQGTRPPR
jgi:hypothetical protein